MAFGTCRVLTVARDTNVSDPCESYVEECQGTVASQEFQPFRHLRKESLEQDVESPTVLDATVQLVNRHAVIHNAVSF